MRVGAIDFPDDVVRAITDGSCVFFAGAGVSMGAPASLPSFRGLADEIGKRAARMRAEGEQDDQFLGRLHSGGVKVHSIAAEMLSTGDPKPTSLHTDLLRCYRGSADLRIVTTNFDALFEEAARDIWPQGPEVFRAPALPLGRSFRGIVHVHGALERPEEMVLTDADFGRAYLSEGWALRFLIDLFATSTTVFVGYSHDDVMMQYLARALPRSNETMRYALVSQRETDGGRWKRLGIEPLVFPNPDESFSELAVSLKEAANLVSRGALDRKRRLEELAAYDPSSPGLDTSELEYALDDADLMRLFCSANPHPGWLEWMDKRGVLDPLFDDAPLDGPRWEIARWIARELAVPHHKTVMSRLVGRKLRLNPFFWRELVRGISGNKQGAVDRSVLVNWALVLVAALPDDSDGGEMTLLAECCVRNGAYGCLALIVDALTEPQVAVNATADFTDDWMVVGQGAPQFVYRGASWELPDIMSSVVLHCMEHVAEAVLEVLVHNLGRLHGMQTLLGRADRVFDSLSFMVSAVESHELNALTSRVSPVVSAARDCLEWLALHRSSSAAEWTERLVARDAPLLRRLAVHTVTERVVDLTADERIDWLLAHSMLYDLSVRHEFCRCLGAAYRSATGGNRRRVVKTIVEEEAPCEGSGDRDRLTIEDRLSWLMWLVEEVASDCTVAGEALERMRSEHPDVTPGPHPDPRAQGGPWVPPQLWTPEQLLGWGPRDVLSACEEQPQGYDERKEFGRAVSEAAVRDPEWGLALADALAQDGQWASSLWGRILFAWAQAPMDDGTYAHVLEYLAQPELQCADRAGVVGLLASQASLAKELPRPDVCEAVYAVSDAVWDRLGSAPAKEGSLTGMSLFQHPAYNIAMLRLRMLSLDPQRAQHQGERIPEPHCAALTRMARDSSERGVVARSVFLRAVCFLAGVDACWVKDRLVPLLDKNGLPEYERLSYWHALFGDPFFPTYHVAPLVEETFLRAMPMFGSRLHEDRESFVTACARIVAFHVDRPMDKWIPQLLNSAGAEDRLVFAREVLHLLKRLDDRQRREWWDRWVREYITARLDGCFGGLAPEEFAETLNWVVYTGDAFEDAVELVRGRSSPPASLRIYMPFEVRQSDVVKRWPEATARLALWMRQVVFAGDVKFIVGSVDAAKLTDETRKALYELCVLKGVDASGIWNDTNATDGTDGTDGSAE